MIKASLNVTNPRRQGRHAPGSRTGSPSCPGRARRARSGGPVSSLTAMSEWHIAALVREVEMSEVEEVRSTSGANPDDSLLDPAFDDDYAGWGVQGNGQYRPRQTWTAAHFRLDGEGSD